MRSLDFFSPEPSAAARAVLAFSADGSIVVLAADNAYLVQSYVEFDRRADTLLRLPREPEGPAPDIGLYLWEGYLAVWRDYEEYDEAWRCTRLRTIFPEELPALLAMAPPEPPRPPIRIPFDPRRSRPAVGFHALARIPRGWHQPRSRKEKTRAGDWYWHPAIERWAAVEPRDVGRVPVGDWVCLIRPGVAS